MTRNRNRNKERKLTCEFGSQEMLNALYQEHGIKATSHEIDGNIIVAVSLPNFNKQDKQPDNIVNELPLKQVLARL